MNVYGKSQFSLKNSDRMDSTHQDALKRNLPEFTSSVDPRDILPFITCISTRNQEQIRNIAHQQSTYDAATELYFRLIQRPKGFEQLLTALRDPDVGLNSLADKLDPPNRSNRTNGIVVAESTSQNNSGAQSYAQQNNVGEQNEASPPLINDTRDGEAGNTWHPVEGTYPPPSHNTPDTNMPDINQYPVQEEGTLPSHLSLRSEQNHLCENDGKTSGERPSRETAECTSTLNSEDNLYSVSDLPKPAWKKSTQANETQCRSSENQYLDTKAATFDDNRYPKDAITKSKATNPASTTGTFQTNLSQNNDSFQSQTDNEDVSIDTNQTNVKELASVVYMNKSIATNSTFDKEKQRVHGPNTGRHLEAEMMNFNAVGDTKPVADKSMDRIMHAVPDKNDKGTGHISQSTLQSPTEGINTACTKVDTYCENIPEKESPNTSLGSCLTRPGFHTTEDRSGVTEALSSQGCPENIDGQHGMPGYSCENYIDYSLGDKLRARINADKPMDYSSEWRSIENKTKKNLFANDVSDDYDDGTENDGDMYDDDDGDGCDTKDKRGDDDYDVDDVDLVGNDKVGNVAFDVRCTIIPDNDGTNDGTNENDDVDDDDGDYDDDKYKNKNASNRKSDQLNQNQEFSSSPSGNWNLLVNGDHSNDGDHDDDDNSDVDGDRYTNDNNSNTTELANHYPGTRDHANGDVTGMARVYIE